jgi:hypothetical protein
MSLGPRLRQMSGRPMYPWVRTGSGRVTSLLAVPRGFAAATATTRKNAEMESTRSSSPAQRRRVVETPLVSSDPTPPVRDESVGPMEQAGLAGPAPRESVAMRLGAAFRSVRLRARGVSAEAMAVVVSAGPVPTARSVRARACVRPRGALPPALGVSAVTMAAAACAGPVARTRTARAGDVSGTDAVAAVASVVWTRAGTHAGPVRRERVVSRGRVWSRR